MAWTSSGLELTNRCNLRCVHCYADSHPGSGYRDVLSAEQYISLMAEAFELGCRKIRLIGGEPQLHPDFLELLRATKRIGYEFVEVFSNLTKLDENTLLFATEHGICFATSVYSDDAAVHDAVTKVRGSHARTVRNLSKLIDAAVTTRAGLIVIDQDQAAVTRTKRFLDDLGVGEVRIGTLREFGRGEDLLHHGSRMSGSVRALLARQARHHARRGRLPLRSGRTWAWATCSNHRYTRSSAGPPFMTSARRPSPEVRLPQAA
ncbi:MAG TPA: radical SAM protein, partial [Candidatus Limnocylindrales bacterium]|nr:radical SAM protein [Candidatus Limnocylindrales bacterium]